jgi:nucleotide-binding universal stress UspA family protein
VTETIVVGVDASEDSRRAVAWAAGAAASLGTRVVAVHAVGLLEHRRGDPSGAHLLPELEVWTRDLGRLPAGLVERRLVPGDPVGALVQVAAEEGASLVVVGTRGEGARPGALLGSTSLQLAERSAGPLVIVPGANWSG